MDSRHTSFSTCPILNVRTLTKYQLREFDCHFSLFNLSNSAGSIVKHNAFGRSLIIPLALQIQMQEDISIFGKWNIDTNIYIYIYIYIQSVWHIVFFCCVEKNTATHSTHWLTWNQPHQTNRDASIWAQVLLYATSGWARQVANAALAHEPHVCERLPGRRTSSYSDCFVKTGNKGASIIS